jgi:hypothetical protein
MATAEARLAAHDRHGGQRNERPGSLKASLRDLTGRVDAGLRDLHHRPVVSVWGGARVRVTTGDRPLPFV